MAGKMKTWNAQQTDARDQAVREIIFMIGSGVGDWENQLALKHLIARGALTVDQLWAVALLLKKAQD